MRVTHTPFSTPVRVIGRDAELTLAFIGALGRVAGVKSTRFGRFLDIIKLTIK